MDWFGLSNKSFDFDMFSRNHFIVLGIFVFISVLIFLNRKTLREDKWKRAEIVVVISIILIEITNQLWMYVNGVWKLGRSMPLELCNIGLILSVILLLTRKKLVFEILFFIAILGATQAIATPALKYDFPHFRFLHFFYAHMIVVWVTLYFTWAKGYYITLKSVVKLAVFINLLLPVILFINKHADGNYWFLRHKPKNATLMDLLGPYPWYILSLEVLLIVSSLIIWLISRKWERSIERRSYT